MENILAAFRKNPNHSKVQNAHGLWVHTCDSDNTGADQYLFAVHFELAFQKRSASAHANCANFDELVAAARTHFEQVPCAEPCDSESGADDPPLALPGVNVDDQSCLVEFGSVEKAAEFVYELMTVVWQDAPYEISSY